MKITEHNCETNVVIERDMTKDEISKLEATQKEFNERLSIKEAAKASALAKLAALGLTPEEISAIS